MVAAGSAAIAIPALKTPTLVAVEPATPNAAMAKGRHRDRRLFGTTAMAIDAIVNQRPTFHACCCW